MSERDTLLRKSIVVAGIFLIVVGSISLIFGIWYAWTYGIAVDTPTQNPWHFLRPELSGNLLWLISVSCSMIVLGIIFILWGAPIKESK